MGLVVEKSDPIRDSYNFVPAVPFLKSAQREKIEDREPARILATAFNDPITKILLLEDVGVMDTLKTFPYAVLDTMVFKVV